MTTLHAAVLGSPVSHSLSPTLHAAAYAAAGLTDWAYERHEVREPDLAGFVAGLDASWRGLSLTMPLKEVAVEVASTVTEVARRARAINTLMRRADGGWDATNTDVAGLVRALRRHLPEGAERATVLGTGATARSAVLALAELGVHTLVVRGRDGAKAADLCAFALDAGLRSAGAGPLAPWGRTAGQVVISALAPAAGPDAAACVPPEQAGVLLDVVYAGWPTPLAAAAAASGMTVVSGVDMLVYQAAEQFELFTGVAADTAAMFAALPSGCRFA